MHALIISFLILIILVIVLQFILVNRDHHLALAIGLHDHLVVCLVDRDCCVDHLDDVVCLHVCLGGCLHFVDGLALCL